MARGGEPGRIVPGDYRAVGRGDGRQLSGGADPPADCPASGGASFLAGVPAARRVREMRLSLAGAVIID